MARLYDAHNHLQDERFGGGQEDLVAVCRSHGVVAMMVNGSCEADWGEVVRLAERYPGVVWPSLGLHPWYVPERSPRWLETLRRLLETHPAAGVGEIGLDRWKPGLDPATQEEVFRQQWRLAVEQDRPASLHCLQAWGRLLDLLRAEPPSARGFLLHSYGGPAEMVEPLARLGAYFSLPGYFAHERKHRQREAFRRVPLERLLIETDAPDQRLPARPAAGDRPGGGVGTCEQHPLTDPRTGALLNHPANLAAVYALAAQIFETPVAGLAEQVEANFLRLFG